MIADIAKSYGKSYPLDVRMKILGTTEQRTAEIAVNDLKLPISIGEFHKKFNDLGYQRLGDAPLLRGTCFKFKGILFLNFLFLLIFLF